MADVQPLGDSTPVLTLTLSGHPDLVLNLGRETLSSDPKLRIKRHETSRPVTLLLDGLQGDDYGLDVVTALQQDLLQLLDADSRDVIVIPPRDTTPYLIGFSASGGRSWCQYGPKENPSRSLGKRSTGVPPFATNDRFHRGYRPTFSASLSTSSDVCHLFGGSPTFDLIVSVTSHETRPITVAMEDTPFHLAQGLDDIFEIQDQETDERLELLSGAGCFLDNTGPADYPSRLILQDFLPREPYVRKYALAPANGGELECLRDGHRYSVRPSRAILHGFGSWCWGRQGELPEDAEEVRKLLRDNGQIGFAVRDVPVIFKAER